MARTELLPVVHIMCLGENKSRPERLVEGESAIARLVTLYIVWWLF